MAPASFLDALRAELNDSAQAGGTLQAVLLGEAYPTLSNSTSAAALTEALQLLTEEQIAKLWTVLDSLVEAVLNAKFYEPAAASDVAGQSDAGPMAVLTRSVALLSAWVTDDKVSLSAAFWQTVQRFHAVILHIEDTKDGRGLRTAICKLNEKLWAQERPERNSVASLTLVVLLVEALEEGATDGVVRRLWGMRGALGLFEWSEPENDSLRELLLSCFARPLFTKNGDNRRVLGAIMAQCAPLVPEAHAVARAQLGAACAAASPGGPTPAGLAKAGEAWGDVYYRAWAGAPDAASRLALEQGALQDLVSRGLGAARPAAFAAVRALLSVFVGRKQARARGVEAMLLRTYAPLLFRALEAPNSAVRRNAAQLLLDAFPLRDTPAAAAAASGGGVGKGAAAAAEGEADASSSSSSSSVMLSRQFSALSGLLLDPCSSVREVGVSGVASVLATYWEAIPPAASKALLERLIHDCAHDAASPAVRAAVPPALAVVAGNVLSHPLLGAPDMLPALGDLLHDRSERVRASLAGLLLDLCDLRSLPVFELFPVDGILARLTLDQGVPAVARPLARLLVRSYFPPGADNRQLMERLIRGLEQHEAATYAFLSHAGANVPLGTLSKYVLLVHRVVAKSLTSYALGVAELAAAPPQPTAGAGPAGGGPAQAADDGGDDGEAPAAVDGEDGGEEEDAGFARKKKGGKKAAAVTAAAAATKRDRKGKPKGSAAPEGEAEAPAPSPQSQAAQLAHKLKTLAALTRCLAIVWASLSPLLADSEAEAVVPSSRGKAGGKGGKKGGKGGKAAADAAAAAVDGLIDERAGARAQLYASFGGDAIGSLLRSLASSAPLPGEGAGTGGALDVGGAKAAITSSLLSIAGHLPPEALDVEGAQGGAQEGATEGAPAAAPTGATGLASSLWPRLLSLGEGEEREVPGLLQCLAAWGRAGHAVQAATRALTQGGSAASGPGLSPTIAVLILECLMAMAAQPGSAVALPGEDVEAAMGALAACMRALVPALEAPHLPSESSKSVESVALLALPVAAARAWCRMLLHATAITAQAASPSDAAALAASAMGSQLRWAGEELLKAAVLRRETLGTSAAGSDAPSLAAAAVLTVLAATASDLCVLGAAVEPSVGLLQALTNDAQLWWTPAPAGDGGEGGGRYAEVTPMEWSCGTASVSGDADGALPVATLRLCLRLHSIACGNVTAGLTSGAPQPVVLASGSRTAVWKAVARVLVTIGGHAPPAGAAVTTAATADDGEEDLDEGGDDGPRAARAGGIYPLLASSWTSALAECVKPSAVLLAGGSVSRGGFTSDFLACALPEVEPAVRGHEDGDGSSGGSGGAEASEHPTATALVNVCAGASSSGRASSLLAPALAQALSFRWTTLKASYPDAASDGCSATAGFRRLAALFSDALPETQPGAAAARALLETLT